MGRGKPTSRPLQLTALLPTYNQQWFDSLTVYDQVNLHTMYDRANLHTVETPSCLGFKDTQPSRFVIAGIKDFSDVTETHVFSTYADLESVLELFLSDLRDITPYVKHLLEYQPQSATFKILKPALSASGYIPPDVQPQANRADVVHSIVTARGCDALRYFGRFLFLIRSNDGKITHATSEVFRHVDDFATNLANSTAKFLAFYDIDVSDQPIPLRFYASCTDAFGVVHEVIEPI